jgi:hypothetical protein
MEKIQIQDPRSGMNILDLIIVNLVAVLWLNILKLFDADADPGSGMQKVRSGINIPDPKHWS